MSMLFHEPALPALPLPDLQASCAFALELITPLVDETKLQASRAALEELLLPDGAGQRLQKALLRHQARIQGGQGGQAGQDGQAGQEGQGGNASWLRPFWDDMYLAWRETLPVHMNYIFCLETERWGGVEALPRLLGALTLIFRSIGQGTLPPQPVSGKAAPGSFLSMEQANCCVYTRIPLPGSDILRPVNLGGALHAAVTCHGHWFILPLCDTAGRLPGPVALGEALARIRREAALLPPGPAVSAFTAARRETAAQVRTELLANTLNRQNLAAIESAALVLCLDEDRANDNELCHHLLCGNAATRWFDKSLQIISSANGGLGLNFEHSGCDAGIWHYLFSLADAALTGQTPWNELGRFSEGLKITPRCLDWQIAENTAARLEELRREFAHTGQNLALQTGGGSVYSREAVKGLRTSPDAFLQIAFQAAQYQLFGQLRSSYEAVAVRQFYQGRTEVCRGSSAEAAALAKALAAGDKALLAPLYRAAEKTHLARLARARQALGAERHFSGLQTMFAMRGQELGLNSLPAIFSDPGWLALKRDSLSTSAIGADFIRYFGFGPVVDDGLGVGYAPSKNFTNLVFTGYKGKSPAPAEFARAFSEAARNLAAALNQE